MNALNGRNILLVITGGIAAYKALELIRLIRKSGGSARCVLTQGGAQFVTPLAVSALSGAQTYTDLFSLKDETEMGHIRLSREADLIVVAPASASFIAKMAWGLADDLASTVLLAADKPVMIAPAMNPMMWEHPATRANIGTLRRRGVRICGPCAGDMACGETGIGRMAEPEAIREDINSFFRNGKLLAGMKILVTSGPTYEPLDPVRFIGNRSSGKQGHAVAAVLAEMGASVTLVTGPVALPDPLGVSVVHVGTAEEMLVACRAVLPVDVAICAAAVSDWAPETVNPSKMKKGAGKASPSFILRETPDILSVLAAPSSLRPRLVVGFAAETENLVEQARQKRIRKGCDWIVANDVGGCRIFGADDTNVTLITADGQESWQGTKRFIAENLGRRIAGHMDSLPAVKRA